MNYRLYIGSNNATKELEKDKALKIVSSNFEGFTSYEAVGYWQGQKEKTLIIEVETQNKTRLSSCIQRLITELKQQAIGLAKTPAIEFIN